MFQACQSYPRENFNKEDRYLLLCDRGQHAMLFTNGTVSPPPPEGAFSLGQKRKGAESALITAASFFPQSHVYFLVLLRFSLLMNNSFLALLRA